MPWLLLVCAFAMAAPVRDLTAGKGHTCALDADGGATCWGGLEDAAARRGDEPTRLVPVPIPGLKPATQLAAGGGVETCASHGGGPVTCWDAGGALRTVGVDARQVVLGVGHGCALEPSGTVQCWGLNNRGQLGDGSTDDREAPGPVAGLSDAVQLATGFYHTCAVRSSGGVACWGAGENGQLGDGRTERSAPTPVPVRFLLDAVQVTAGAFHTCARRSNGGVVCWGSNGSGQLGDGTRGHSASIVAVRNLGGATQISAGMDSTCAVRDDERLTCWGNNERGQLGNPDNKDHLLHRVVRDLPQGVRRVAMGHQHTCALLADDAVWCWGQNFAGQLGDGTRTLRSAPAPVAVP